MGCFAKMPVFAGHMWESICQKNRIVAQFSCVWTQITIVPISAIGHHLHSQIAKCAVAIEEQMLFYCKHESSRVFEGSANYV